MNDAKNKTPEQWANEIANLPVQNEIERAKIANIVWWDYFSERTFQNSWPHLNDLLNKCDASFDIPPERIEELLMILGWSREAAHYRSFVSNGKMDNVACSKRNTGVESCFYAICEQAVEDFKNLSRSGIIVNGKVKEGWPKAGSYGSIGYHNRLDVEKLLEWITDGSLLESMRSLGCFVEEHVLMSSLGLVKTSENCNGDVA